MLRRISAAMLNHATLYVLGVLFFAFIVISIVQDRTAQKNLRSVEAISELITRLEADIGYGGLIHNLKNGLLRPDEPAYFESAYQDAFHALSVIEEIEETSNNFNFEATFPNTRAMILAYTDRMGTAETMIADGDLAREIDVAIRYDDTAALNEIISIRQNLHSQFRKNADTLRSMTLWIMALMAIIMLLPLIAIYQVRLAKKRERIAQMVKDLNDALELQNSNLKQSNSALRQFAGIVSHDLKAPARQVHMFADIALSAKDSPELLENSLNSIRDLSDEMEDLIGRLLEFTHATFQEPQYELTELTEIIEKCAERATSLSAAPPVFHIGNVPSAYVDPVLMERVICNIIQNAVKYVEKGTVPEIHVSARENRAGLTIDITDNGPGIDAKYADIIFDPLRRIRKANQDDVPEGSGLGLAIVRVIVEAHGGTVKLDKDYKGGGSRFSIQLPRALVIGNDLMTA